MDKSQLIIDTINAYNIPYVIAEDIVSKSIKASSKDINLLPYCIENNVRIFTSIQNKIEEKRSIKYSKIRSYTVIEYK